MGSSIVKYVHEGNINSYWSKLLTVHLHDKFVLLGKP